MRINYMVIFFYSKESIESFLECEFIKSTVNFSLEEKNTNSIKVFFKNFYFKLKLINCNKSFLINDKFKLNYISNSLKELSILTDIHIFQKKNNFYIPIRKVPNNSKVKFKILKNEYIVLEFNKNIQNKIILLDDLDLFIKY